MKALIMVLVISFVLIGCNLLPKSQEITFNVNFTTSSVRIKYIQNSYGITDTIIATSSPWTYKYYDRPNTVTYLYIYSPSGTTSGEILVNGVSKAQESTLIDNSPIELIVSTN